MEDFLVSRGAAESRFLDFSTDKRLANHFILLLNSCNDPAFTQIEFLVLNFDEYKYSFSQV